MTLRTLGDDQVPIVIAAHIQGYNNSLGKLC
jgi:hypothetical protein